MKRTEKYIEKRFWWPGWRRSVYSTIRSCDGCTIGKTLTTKIVQRPLEFPEVKFDMISLDYFGFGAKSISTCRGFKGIITVVERLTGFCQFWPAKTKQMRR